LIDLLLRLAETVRELRWSLAATPSTAGRFLAHALSKTTRVLDRRLSAHGAAHLAPLLLMSATCALAGESLRDRVRARVTIEHLGLLWSFPQHPASVPPPAVAARLPGPPQFRQSGLSGSVPPPPICGSPRRAGPPAGQTFQ